MYQDISFSLNNYNDSFVYSNFTRITDWVDHIHKIKLEQFSRLLLSVNFLQQDQYVCMYILSLDAYAYAYIWNEFNVPHLDPHF